MRKQIDPEGKDGKRFLFKISAYLFVRTRDQLIPLLMVEKLVSGLAEWGQEGRGTRGRAISSNSKFVYP